MTLRVAHHGYPVRANQLTCAACFLLLAGCGLTAKDDSESQPARWWPWLQESISTPSTPDTNPAVASLVEKGDLALAKDRLNVPAHDNALLFYRQALDLEPDNARALQGIRQVAKRYRSLARTAHDNGNSKLAQRYLQQAESITGIDHPANRKLRRELSRTLPGQNQRALDRQLKADFEERKSQHQRESATVTDTPTP